MFTASDFDICCLVRGRLNKFKVKKTATFSHVSSLREKKKITVGETVLVLVQNLNEYGREPVVRVVKTTNTGKTDTNMDTKSTEQAR